MKACLLIFFTLLLSVLNLSAQQIEWLQYHEEPGLLSVRFAQVDDNGNMLFCGIKKPAIWGIPTLAGNYVARYDSLGNKIFHHLFDGKLHINQVMAYNENSYLICGLIDDEFLYNEDSIKGTQVFCGRMTNSGILLWMFTDSTVITQNSRMVIGPDSTIFFSAGNTNNSFASTGKIYKLNSQGNVLHTEFFTNAMASDIDIDSHGNIYLAAMGFVLDTVFFDDLFSPDTANIGMMKNLVVKYDPGFQAQWIHESPGHDGDLHPGICVSGNGLYWYRHTLGSGINDFYPVVSHIDSSGNLVNRVVIGQGNGPDHFRAWNIECQGNHVNILFEENNNILKTYDLLLNPIDSFTFNLPAVMGYNKDRIFLAGTIHTFQSLIFENGQSLQGPTASISDTVFIASVIDQNIQAIVQDYTFRPTPIVYPNPARDKIQIKSVYDPNNVTVSIYTLQGQRKCTIQGKTTININTLPLGIYIVEIKDQETSAICRLVKPE